MYKCTCSHLSFHCSSEESLASPLPCIRKCRTVCLHIVCSVCGESLQLFYTCTCIVYSVVIAAFLACVGVTFCLPASGIIVSDNC